MSIIYKLADLNRYYQSTRQVGHTTAMLDGARNTKGVIVMAHTMHFAQMLARECQSAIPVSFSGKDLGHALFGRHAPLIIDNSAIVLLLDEAITEIKRLQSEIETLEKQLISVQYV